MKYITMAIPARMDEPIVFLVRPTTTTADIRSALKLNKDFVIFSASDPRRHLDQKDELYEQVTNGDRLFALFRSEATEFYHLSLLLTTQEFTEFFTKRVRKYFGKSRTATTTPPLTPNHLY